MIIKKFHPGDPVQIKCADKRYDGVRGILREIGMLGRHATFYVEIPGRGELGFAGGELIHQSD